MEYYIPRGFKFSGIYSGIKRDKSREDLVLVTSDRPCTAAGVYTQNLVCAAPVIVDRGRTPSKDVRAVVVNSGNANACTGERGLADAKTMARIAAECAGASDEKAALVMSTGIIGHFLPMEIVEQGIRTAAEKLASDEASLIKTARGLMTTDTRMKLFSTTVTVDGTPVNVVVMGKGAGMIAPKMATFLGMILTDARMKPATADMFLQRVADRTINCVTIDGHTSTNDSFLLLANGAAYENPENAPDAAESPEFYAAVEKLCTQLARAMADDGEGASHMITIKVRGLKTEVDARRVARSVADSPLVKCAFAGNDPNWGRIVSAAGYVDVPFDVAKVSLRVNGFLLFDAGAPAAFDPAEVSASMAANREITVELTFGEGKAGTRFWTSDLTAEYVHINADYHT